MKTVYPSGNAAFQWLSLLFPFVGFQYSQMHSPRVARSPSLA